MADIAHRFETLEHRAMRAWIGCDKGEMKALLAGNLMGLSNYGTERLPAVVLRRPAG